MVPSGSALVPSHTAVTLDRSRPSLYRTRHRVPRLAAISNKCHASSNKCLTSSNKKLVEALVTNSFLLLLVRHLLLLAWHLLLIAPPALRMGICWSASRIMITSNGWRVESQLVYHWGAPQEWRSQCCKTLLASGRGPTRDGFGCDPGVDRGLVAQQEGVHNKKRACMGFAIVRDTYCYRYIESMET